LQGVYAAAWEGARVVAVAAHYRNGVLMLQATVALAEVARAAVAASGRAVRGIAAPHARLVVPEPIASGRWTVRAPREDELDLLVERRVAYALEVLGDRDTPALRERSRGEMVRAQATGAHWVLVVDGRPLSFTAFNQQRRLPRAVWTDEYADAVGAPVQAAEAAEVLDVQFEAHGALRAHRRHIGAPCPGKRTPDIAQRADASNSTTSASTSARVTGPKWPR
jgi:hypothetical protein